jgi:hypothetical protein
MGASANVTAPVPRFPAAAMSAAPSSHLVLFDADAALIDLTKIKSREERKAIFNVVDKLRQLGPQLVPPHAKSLKGETDLFELRPRQGHSPSRPLFKRSGSSYVILAISKDHEVDMSDAIADAKARAARYP